MINAIQLTKRGIGIEEVNDYAINQDVIMWDKLKRLDCFYYNVEFVFGADRKFRQIALSDGKLYEIRKKIVYSLTYELLKSVIVHN